MKRTYRKTIKLRETELKRMIGESVKRIIREGQGWTAFKNASNRIFNGYYDDRKIDDEDNRQFNNFINTGSTEGFDYDYYDPEYGNGVAQNTGHKINKGFTGRLGRRAAVAGTKAAHSIRQGYNKIRGRR